MFIDDFFRWEEFNMNLNEYEEMTKELLTKYIDEQEESGKLIDEKKLDSLIKKFYSKEFIDNHAANPIYENLKIQAPKMIIENQLIQNEFESRLQLRWLNAFYDLMSIIKIAEETATDIIDDYMENHSVVVDSEKQAVSLTFDVLMRIFSKSLVVSKEIHTLLSSGFVDGAMARWRSLHESNVYFRVLTHNYENENFTRKLVEKYADYSIVENYQEVFKYKIKDDSFELEEKEFGKLKSDYHRILEKYGSSFTKPYSWAKELFPKKDRIYFSDLEKKAGIDHLSIYYKQANYQVHTSPTGLYNSLGNIQDDRVKQYAYVLGPSNYGLSTPGQLTAISLMQITTSLLLLNSNIDRVIRVIILQKLVDDAINEFDKIQAEIEEEELTIYEGNKEFDN